MVRPFAILVFSSAVVFASAKNVEADLVYTAEDFTFTDPDWTFDGGTFTTNGFIGTITPANVSTVFTAWDLSFTSPVATYNLTPANSSLLYTADVPAATNLEVTATEILWPNTANPGPGNDSIQIIGDGFTQIISYSAADGPGRASNISLEDSSLLRDFFVETGDANIGVPVTIASVPEPNSFLCLSIVGSVGVGIRRWRNRRTQG